MWYRAAATAGPETKPVFRPVAMENKSSSRTEQPGCDEELLQLGSCGSTTGPNIKIYNYAMINLFQNVDRGELAKSHPHENATRFPDYAASS